MKKVIITEAEVVIPAQVIPAKKIVQYESNDGRLWGSAAAASEHDAYCIARDWIAARPTYVSDILNVKFIRVQSQEELNELVQHYKVFDKYSHHSNDVGPTTVFPAIITIYNCGGGDSRDHYVFADGSEELTAMRVELAALEALYRGD